MSVIDKINRRSRTHEARGRVKAGRDKLKGGAFEAAGSARTSAADAESGARSTLMSTRKTIKAARGRAAEAVRETPDEMRRGAKRARKSGRRAYIEARVSAARRAASRPEGAPKKSVAAAGVAGAAATYFLDPKEGNSRRHHVREIVAKGARKTADRLRKVRGSEDSETAVPSAAGNRPPAAPAVNGTAETAGPPVTTN